MDIYITLYNIRNATIGHPNRTMCLHNGFSFGRDKKPEDVDLFFNTDNINIANHIQSSINYYKPNKIWASIIFEDSLVKLYKIIDDKWIVGGPMISIGKDRENLHRYFTGKKPTLVYTTMEEYLGKETSSDFDPYFLNFTSKFSNHIIAYSMSLSEYKCYWGKCNFCVYSKLEKISNIHFKRDLEKIIKSAVPSFYDNKNLYIAHGCDSSTSVSMLKTVVEVNNNLGSFFLFLRPDPGILEQLKKIDDLTYYHFTIGAEAFSQPIIDKLNKGFKIETLLEVVEEILKKHGSINLTTMNNYIFLTKDIVDDYINNFKKVEDLYKKYVKNNYLCVLPYYIYWYDKYEAEEFGFSSKKENQIIPVYSSIIPKDHEQFRFNKEIDDYVSSSIIPSLLWSF